MTAVQPSTNASGQVAATAVHTDAAAAIGLAAPFYANRRIDMIPVSRLKPYQGNARTHSKKQVRQIADSIRQFGFNNPVLVDEACQIIAGHGRVAAAKLVGMKEVPTLCLSHLSAAEKRAYVLADNRLAEKAGWDQEILAIELQALIDIDFHVESIGFEAGEVDVILLDADEARREANGPEDEAPEPRSGPAISQVGDLWLLGRHRLLCGDARDKQAYERLLEGEKAAFVFADAPYNVPIDGHVRRAGQVQHREFAMASGEMSPEAFTGFLTTVFRLLVANTTDGSIHDICMDWRHLGEMMAAGNAAYTELKNLCVWAKKHAGMGYFYRSRHELVFIWKNGLRAHISNFEHGEHGRSRSNVWEYAGANSMRAGRLEELEMHPTVKPVALVADAIKDCTRRNGIVLDPFMGSGTTVIAAERTGRRACGIEIDPAYVDVTIRRWQAHTGKAATLAASGQTFEEVEETRSIPTLPQAIDRAEAGAVEEAR